LPVVVHSRTMSPESIVSTGLSDASKKPRCTVVGEAFNSWIFSSAFAAAAHRVMTLAQNSIREVRGDHMNLAILATLANFASRRMMTAARS
jgi:hypothetical protein